MVGVCLPVIQKAETKAVKEIKAVPRKEVVQGTLGGLNERNKQ